MINKTQIYHIFILYVILPSIFSPTIFNLNANKSIPEIYYQNLDLDLTYTYNVSKFDSIIQWWGLQDFCFCHKGDAFVPIGGQIKITFTGFFTTAYYEPAFSDPSPHLNVEFVGNSTFYNWSNTEVGGVLGCGFNSFYPGFLIPVNNLTGVKTEALKHANPLKEWHEIGEDIVEEYDSMIKIEFHSLEEDLTQKILIYDKNTGILLYLNREDDVPSIPNIEMSLSGYNFDYQKPAIPSYQLVIFLILISMISIAYINILRHKIRIRSF